MAFVPGPNVAQAELVYSLDGQVIENTLYFEASAGLDTALMGTLASNLISLWTANFAPNLSTAVSLTQVVVTDLTTDSSPAILVPLSPAESGEVDSPPLPNNVSLAISFKTAFRGRSSRGRNYVPCLCESQVVGNTVASLFASNIVAAYEEMLGAGGFVTGLEWGVFSRFSNGAPRTTGLFRPITAVTVFDLTVDSMRRRLPGRGT